MDTPLNIGELINKAPISALQVRVFVLAIAVALVDGYDTQTVAYALSSMASEWGAKPQDFAPALTIGLFGLMVGGIVMGQLGDKFGRKPLILVATLIFGVSTFAIAHAQSIDSLFWLRFVAGVGLGGVLPNITTIVADYSPETRRRTAVMIVIGALAAGAFLGGLLAKVVIPAYGWRVIFEVGGGLSLFMAAVCAVFLPESPGFLAARNGSDPRLVVLLRKIAPTVPIGPTTRFLAHAGEEQRASVLRLFAAGRAPITLLLWAAMIAQLIVVYIFSLWLPTLVKENGNAVDVSLLASSLFSLGGLVGSFALGPISEQFGAHRTLATSYVLVGVISVILAKSGTNVPLIYCASFLVGTVAFGTWSALSALIAKFYPTEIRATGIGYASGLGRAGSMLSPILVGFFLAASFKAADILLLPLAPAGIAAVCIVAVGMLRKRSANADESVPAEKLAQTSG